ncbi:MAG: beta-ketoacyl-ACP reductase [Gemmatimonadetes bacterium]|nr:beta-ketoacyl-ACP reductase [Gemmatimonadota bacterium]
MKNLAGKTALVTGGSRGIGKAICLALAQRGAQVVFSYEKSVEEAEKLAADIAKKNGSALPVRADARDPDEAKMLFHKTIEEFGGLDILINNAGIVQPSSLAFMSDEAWKSVVETNLHGAFYLCRISVQHLLKQKLGGSIINIASVAGLRTSSGQSNYIASKSALIAFSRALAREVAQYSIRVNVVAPGLIDTDMVRAISKEKLADFLGEIPMGRLGYPDEVANVVCFLLSEEASYITGSVLRIDGGLGA